VLYCLKLFYPNYHPIRFGKTGATLSAYFGRLPYGEEKQNPVQKPESHILLVGQALKDYRKTHGITQEHLAEDLDIDPRTLRSWENERVMSHPCELKQVKYP
jgi:Helix-turn-helix